MNRGLRGPNGFNSPQGHKCAERQDRINKMQTKKTIETRSAPASLGATHRAFTFYLGNPISSILKIMFILSKAP